MSDSAVLILSADKYSIPDQKTGEVNDLHQVWMANNYRVSTDTEKGSKPVKTLVEAGVFAELMKHELPGLFDISLTMRPGSGNKLSAVITGFKFLSTPKIFGLAKAA